MKPFLLAVMAIWLGSVSAFAQTTSIFQSGATWKYLVTSANAVPAAAWKADPSLAPAFNDAGWPTGASPLGYGGASETGSGAGTCVNQCVSATTPTCLTCTTREITTYFRKTINLATVAGSFFLSYRRDDGIVIYINGTEVRRENLPSGLITHTTLASDASDEELWTQLELAPGVLRTGTNVIAVEIHQMGPTSSDIRFDMNLWRCDVCLMRGPYLQRYSDDPNLTIPAGKRSMTIRWSTNVASGGQVIYKRKEIAGTLPGSTTTVSAQTSPKPYIIATNGITLPASRTLYDVSVTLNDLEPDTPYSYTIQSANGAMRQGDAMNYFKTAPLIGAPTKTRMWVLGDFGKQVLPLGGDPDPTQMKISNGFNKYVSSHAATDADKYIDLWLWLGDNAYGWGLPEQYQNYVFEAYDGRRYSSQYTMKQTPIFATPGNHDYHNNQQGTNDPNTPLDYRKTHSLNHYYDVVNNMTAGDSAGKHSRHEEYYSFDHANIHFVSLDTYGFEKGQTTIFPAGSEQLKWLNEDLTLAQANAKIKWIVVFLHHPPYSMGSHQSDTEAELVNIREKLVKGVLENYRVDLVLSGHSHTYERSRPMREHYGAANTFVPTFNAPAGNNGQSSGSYDGTPGNPTGGSCFYYKSATDPKNHIIYIVNGSGGGIEGIQPPCDPANPASPCWPHKAMQTSLNTGGSMYIEVEQDRLDAKFIDENGDVKDQFTIMKDLKSFGVPPTDGTTRKAACECTDAEGWTHYTDLKASLLLSIKKKGATIGTVGDGKFDLQLKGAAGTSVIKANYPTNYVRSTLPSNISGTWTTMNRYWSLTPTTELSGNAQVLVRHYFNEADKVSVQVDGVGPAIAYKINNETGTYNPDPVSGHAAIPKATAYNKNGAWTYDYGDMQTGIGSWYATYGFDVPNLADWITNWDQQRSTSSTASWKSRYMGKGSYWGELVIGRLKGGGGIGTYNRYANPTGNQAMILTGSHWTYFAKGRAPGINWNGITPTAVFNETEWAKDPDDGPGLVSPFGYSPNYEDGERTRVPACAQETCSTKWWTTYFRKSLYLNDVPSYYNYKYYIINYKRDDGIIIYINGKELRRDNMPAGAIDYSTPASTAATDESDWQTLIIPNDGQFFKPGQNIIAAEVHQVADGTGQATSSDMHFDLEVIRTADVVSSTARMTPKQVLLPDEYKVEAYPNPTRDGNLLFSPALPYHSYILTDIQGRVVKQATTTGTLDGLDLSGQQPGVYILVSQGEYGTKWFKLVKN